MHQPDTVAATGGLVDGPAGCSASGPVESPAGCSPVGPAVGPAGDLVGSLTDDPAVGSASSLTDGPSGDMNFTGQEYRLRYSRDQRNWQMPEGRYQTTITKRPPPNGCHRRCGLLLNCIV